MTEQIITRADAIAQGSKHYFTGRPCKQGHISPRIARSRKCVQCGHHYSNVWKDKNRERARSLSRSWKAENPAAGKEWHQQNREKSRAACRRYYERNRREMVERVKPHGRKRRAQKRGCEGTHTVADTRAILAAQRYRCTYCRADLRKVGRHLDHIMPLALGGSNGPENLQYLCPPCNLSKGAKDPLQFAKERELLL